MVHVRTSPLLTRALVFVCLISMVAPASAWALCPTLSAPGVFPGRTDFNNTVRAQMWIDTANAWWGAFSDASSGIYFHRREGGNFVKGDFIDDNFQSGKPDTLFNGLELFVLVFESGSLAKLYKYIPSFVVEGNPLTGFTLRPTYLLLPGFPVDLPLAGLANAIALHQDSTGKLWATYTSRRNVHVIWSTSVDHKTWDTTGMILASNIADFTTEAATIMHFGGDKIGVVWGNQALREIAFRFHHDGDSETVWSQKEIVDCCQDVLDEDGDLKGVADDHLSLRAAPDGHLFLVAKDSIGAGRLHLYVRGGDGTWGQKTIVDPDPVAEPTRPVLLLDVENNHAYVVYRESRTDRIYFSRTPMNSPPVFDPRCTFIDRRPDGGRLSNPTSTKQNVDGTTDLVAVAGREGRSNLPGRPFVPREIFANVIDLESAAGPVSLVAVSQTLEAAPTSVLVVGTPIADIEAIWDGLLSTSTVPLDDGQWRWLRGQDVNTVVNLDDHMFDVAQFGFESFLWVPLGADGAPTEVEAGRFLKFIQVRDNQPAHISSATSDRRATMVALLRYAIDGWTIDNALAEGQRLNGGAVLSSQQVQFLLGWAATHLPGSHRLSWGSTAWTLGP